MIAWLALVLLLMASPAGAYTITNLNDSGPGSLRDAVSRPFRSITCGVTGTIFAQSPIYFLGPSISIDCVGTPITVWGHGLVIWGSRGAHNILVRGLRVRNAAIDGISVGAGATQVVLDHMSVAGSADGNIDITDGARDVVVAWSILGGNDKNMLIKYNAQRVRLHHNLFVGSRQRSPQARQDDAGGVAFGLTVDMWNNVIVSGQLHGTLIWEGANANVVNNMFIVTPGTDDRDALVIINALVYTAGNVLINGTPDPNLEGTSGRWPTNLYSSLGAGGACTEALAVADIVGALPRDDTDNGLLGQAWAALGPTQTIIPGYACQ